LDFLSARFSLIDLPDFLLADCRGDLSDMTLPFGRWWCRLVPVVAPLGHRRRSPDVVMLAERYRANNPKPLRPSSAPIPTIVAKTMKPRKVITVRSLSCWSSRYYLPL
jgi:hypothetical protein